MEKETRTEEEEIQIKTEGLATIYENMVEEIRKQTATFEAGAVAAERRHQESMLKRKETIEQNVWSQACNAALSRLGVGTNGAIDCGDKVLSAFKERFGS